MSSSSGLAAAKRRRGTTAQLQPGQSQQQQQQPEQSQQQQQPPVQLTIQQSIYMLSNRINMLENKLVESINNNALSSGETSPSSESENGENISKIEFNDVMTNIGSDMNELSQKMSTLNEFVTSVQNSYLGLHTAILDIQRRVNTTNTQPVTFSIDEINNVNDNSYNDTNSIVSDNDEHSDDCSINSITSNRLMVSEDVSADITSRLKKLNNHLSKPIPSENNDDTNNDIHESSSN